MEIFYFCSLFSPPRDSINSKGTLFEFLNSGSMTFNWRKKKWLSSYLFPLIEASDMRVEVVFCVDSCMFKLRNMVRQLLSQHDVFLSPYIGCRQVFLTIFHLLITLFLFSTEECCHGFETCNQKIVFLKSYQQSETIYHKLL